MNALVLPRGSAQKDETGRPASVRPPVSPGIAQSDTGSVTLAAPKLGWWLPRVHAGEPLAVGDLVGLIDVLGNFHEVHAPVAGVVAAVPVSRRPQAVGYGDPILELSEQQAVVTSSQVADQPADDGECIRAATAGRVYLRSAPDKAVFVTAGQIVNAGETLCLIEVMKTFSRVLHTGSSRTISDIRVTDGQEVAAGDVLFTLEA